MAIDASGNITLDRAADEFVPLSWTDDTSNTIDISNANLSFIVQGKPELTFSPQHNNSDATGRLIHFTPAFAVGLGSKSRAFRLQLTNSDGTVQDLWSGTITAVGFVA